MSNENAGRFKPVKFRGIVVADIKDVPEEYRGAVLLINGDGGVEHWRCSEERQARTSTTAGLRVVSLFPTSPNPRPVQLRARFGQ